MIFNCRIAVQFITKKSGPNFFEPLWFYASRCAQRIYKVVNDYASKISKILIAQSLMMLPGPKMAAAPALYKKS